MRDASWGPPWAQSTTGTWVADTVHALALVGNPLGDPVDRPLYVWLPPGCDGTREDGRRWPVVCFLHGYVGQVDEAESRRGFEPTLLERIDAAAPPCIVALVDGWTSLGGSQWVDSPAVGRYQSYLSDDVVGHLDRTYPTSGRRGVAGHSSGGYGALVAGLRRPDVWHAVGSLAGDALFEACFLALLGPAGRTLTRVYGGSWAAFLAEVGPGGTRVPLSRGDDFALLELWAMSACWAADDDGTVHPLLDGSGRLDLDVWERWLAHDPVRLLDGPDAKAAAAGWLGCWLEAGDRDDVHLDVALDPLADGLRAAGLAADRLVVQRHPGGHSRQAHRYPAVIAWLAGVLAG